VTNALLTVRNNALQWHQGSKYIKQIDMDIEQTDRDHIFYRQRYGPKYASQLI
jgi:hypothetical protein